MQTSVGEMSHRRHDSETLRDEQGEPRCPLAGCGISACRATLPRGRYPRASADFSADAPCGHLDLSQRSHHPATVTLSASRFAHQRACGPSRTCAVRPPASGTHASDRLAGEDRAFSLVAPGTSHVPSPPSCRERQGSGCSRSVCFAALESLMRSAVACRSSSTSRHCGRTAPPMQQLVDRPRPDLPRVAHPAARRMQAIAHRSARR
jgi:hypothetical protein